MTNRNARPPGIQIWCTPSAIPILTLLCLSSFLLLTTANTKASASGESTAVEQAESAWLQEQAAATNSASESLGLLRKTREHARQALSHAERHEAAAKDAEENAPDNLQIFERKRGAGELLYLMEEIHREAATTTNLAHQLLARADQPKEKKPTPSYRDFLVVGMDLNNIRKETDDRALFDDPRPFFQLYIEVEDVPQLPFLSPEVEPGAVFSMYFRQKAIASTNAQADKIDTSVGLSDIRSADGFGLYFAPWITLHPEYPLYVGAEIGGFFDADDSNKFYENRYVGGGLSMGGGKPYSAYAEVGHAYLRNFAKASRIYFRGGIDVDRLAALGITKAESSQWGIGLQCEVHRPTSGSDPDHLSVVIYLQRDLQGFLSSLAGTLLGTK